MKKLKLLCIVFIGLLLANCNSTTNKKDLVKTDENGYAILTDAQVENIVKRSYQYVAMYNVNNKFALAEAGMSTKGYNKGIKKH